MSLLDIEDKYPDEAWLKKRFVYVAMYRSWQQSFGKWLSWEVPNNSKVVHRNLYFKIVYKEDSKTLTINCDDFARWIKCCVKFDEVVLHNPTQREIEMAMTDEFLSSRIIYKSDK